MRCVSAVCFDLDDTLYAYEAYARAGLLEAADHLAERTGASLHRELLALYFDDGVTDGTFDRLLERHGLPADLVDELVEAFHESDGPLPPYPEAEAVLARLASRHHVGLVTDGRNGCEKLRRLGLDPYFDAVVVAPAAGVSKSETAPFERLLDELGVAPDRTVHVGDDPRTDVRTANRLGMYTVRVRRGRFVDREARTAAETPDAEIRCLSDLPPLERCVVGGER